MPLFLPGFQFNFAILYYVRFCFSLSPIVSAWILFIAIRLCSIYAIYSNTPILGLMTNVLFMFDKNLQGKTRVLPFWQGA